MSRRRYRDRQERVHGTTRGRAYDINALDFVIGCFADEVPDLVQIAERWTNEREQARR